MVHVKIKFIPLSPFSRLFTSDQLWGQMVWALSELESVQVASSFVASFEKDPPFLVSAMLPDGFLPMPVLPPGERKPGMSRKEEILARKEAKKNKSLEWISLRDFKRIQTNVSAIKDQDLETNPEIEDFKETHVTISRDSLCAADGGLFNLSYKVSDKPLACYVRINKDEEKNLKLLESIAKYWEQNHIGGDRNIGRGVFKISVEPVDELEKQVFETNAKCFMTLSRCFGDDLLPMRYRVSVYAGIVGRGIDSNLDVGFYNKQPIIGFEPGSIFSAGMGSLAHNVNTDKRVRSYGYAFPVPIEL